MMGGFLAPIFLSIFKSLSLKKGEADRFLNLKKKELGRDVGSRVSLQMEVCTMNCCEST